MNTPTLTEYEESIAPWNQNDEFDTYYVTATVSMPYTVAIDGNMDFIEVKRKIFREFQDKFKGWEIEDFEIKNY